MFATVFNDPFIVGSRTPSSEEMIMTTTTTTMMMMMMMMMMIMMIMMKKSIDFDGVAFFVPAHVC